MEKSTILKFKDKLEEEKNLLENELGTVSSRNPSNKDDWEPKKVDMDINQADRNEVADELEEFGNNTAITIDLEIRLAEVKTAIEKINNDNFGVCEVGGEEIEEDRLEANPAAKTCKKHIDHNL